MIISILKKMSFIKTFKAKFGLPNKYIEEQIVPENHNDCYFDINKINEEIRSGILITVLYSDCLYFIVSGRAIHLYKGMYVGVNTQLLEMSSITYNIDMQAIIKSRYFLFPYDSNSFYFDMKNMRFEVKNGAMAKRKSDSMG